MPVKIMQVRGTNGAGKSTLVRGLLAAWEGDTYHESLWSMSVHPVYGPLAAIGKYPLTGIGGGCDTVKTQDEVCDRVRQAVRLGCNVVFEGIICTSVVGRYIELQRELIADGHDFLTAFLYPPMNVCIARVEARRAAKGKRTPMNPENLIAKHELIERSAARFLEAGLPHKYLHWEEPLPEVLRFFKGATE